MGLTAGLRQVNGDGSGSSAELHEMQGCDSRGNPGLTDRQQEAQCKRQHDESPTP
jgi:hypothetical protein